MATIVAEIDIANRITIPKAVRELSGLEPGDVVELEITSVKKKNAASTSK